MFTFCLVIFPLVFTSVPDFSDIFLPTKREVFVLCRPVTGPQLPLPLKSKVLKEPTWHLHPQLDVRLVILQAPEDLGQQYLVAASTLKIDPCFCT